MEQALFSVRLKDVRHTPFLSGGIYAIKCLGNNKVYIGSTQCFRARWKEHLRHLRHGKHYGKMQHSFDRYGENSFICTVLEFCEKSELKIKEQHYLDDFKPHINGLNHLSFASIDRPPKTAEVKEKLRLKMLGNKLFLGKKHTPVAIRRMKISQKGHFVSEETKTKIRQKAIGRSISKATRLKISQALTGRKPSVKVLMNSPVLQKGYIKSYTHRLKIAQALTGRILTAEHRANIGRSGFGRVATATTRLKRSESLKRYYENKKHNTVALAA